MRIRNGGVVNGGQKRVGMPSGSRMHSLSTSASGCPVICSTISPASTVLVFEYSHPAPGLKDTGSARPIATSSSGSQARSGSSSIAWLNDLNVV
jgi:hypothetical protein